MADASARSLGAAWLEVHGRGRLDPEHREELRSALHKELEGRAPEGSAPAIKDELDRFIENGRVTDTNLSRLERRVLRRAVGGSGGSATARDDARSQSSGYSVNTGALSARPAASGASQHLPSLPEEMSAPSDTDFSKWSEVAKFSRVLEAQEKMKMKEQRLMAQEQLRLDLQRQEDEKQQKRAREKVWERQLWEHQEADLIKWKETESKIQAEKMHKMLKVKKDREEQKMQNESRKEQELASKLAEDRKAVARAQAELEKEKVMLLDRKKAQREKQMLVNKEWKEEMATKANGKEERQKEERLKIEEYNKMLEEQEARNKQHLPQPRTGEPTVKGGIPNARRGDNVYTEAFLLEQQRKANALAETAEKQKQLRLKTERESNQEFLCQQMEARKRAREEAISTKAVQKHTVQAAMAEYKEQEQKRAEGLRMKNLQYRLELEQQINEKRASERSKLSEDQMSGAERSMNRQLIEAAMKHRLSAHSQP